MQTKFSQFVESEPIRRPVVAICAQKGVVDHYQLVGDGPPTIIQPDAVKVDENGFYYVEGVRFLGANHWPTKE